MGSSARDVRVNEQIDALRAVRDGIADRLPADLVASMDELLANGEPNEALLSMAWRISANRIEVPASVLRFIEDTVGDPGDLPTDLTGRSGPPTRRSNIEQDTATRRAERLSAIDHGSGAPAGVFGPDSLSELRQDWPE